MTGLDRWISIYRFIYRITHKKPKFWIERKENVTIYHYGNAHCDFYDKDCVLSYILCPDDIKNKFGIDVYAS